MRRLASILYILLIAASGSVFAQEEPTDTDPEPILVGPARLDLNVAAGDQSQRQTFTIPQPRTTITVDVAVTEGGKGRSGFEILLSYDPAQIAYETARPVDLFDGAFLMATPGTGQIGLTGLLLEEKSARTIGSIAQITFTVLDEFPGESRISLESALLGTALKIDSVQTGTQSSVVILGGEITTVVLEKPDFDGDGAVGFTDFIIFATGFGSASGDQSYNPLLDLDNNGDVGFSDFLIFALSFGT
jgi:hypothetical protein